MTSRIETLKKMAAEHPDDPRPHFGLALEYERAGRWEAVVTTLRTYLRLTDDQGNAWGRLGHALRELGRDAEAREAYERGAQTAYRHGHPTMGMEFEEILDEMG